MKTATKPYKCVYHVFTWADSRESYYIHDYEEAVGRYYHLRLKYGNARLNEDVYHTLSDYLAMRGEEHCLLSSK